MSYRSRYRLNKSHESSGIVDASSIGTSKPIEHMFATVSTRTRNLELVLVAATEGILSRKMRKSLLSASLIAVAVSGCSSAAVDATTTTSDPGTTTTSDAGTTTTSDAGTATTTTLAVEPPATEAFDVVEGSEGVTFDEDGSPPSGPSSFTILSDGSVVIADTMAVSRGEPRLLRFDRTGEPLGVIDLAQHEVASIVDVASREGELAVLDVLVAMNRYRVLIISGDGDLVDVYEVPDGFHFEDGLTGLEWDDLSPLLAFEFGAWYARIAPGEDPRPEQVLVLDDLEIEITRGSGRFATVRVDDSTFEVERATELGGVAFIGLAPDRTLALVVDEVDTSADAIEVTRRLRRHTASGELLSETVFVAGKQHVAITHPLEMAANGQIFYMRSTVDGITLVPESDLS